MTSRTLAVSFMVAAGIAAAAMPVWAQQPSPHPFIASHPVLIASLERLQSGSAAWRDASDTVAATGRRVIVVTPGMVNLQSAGGAYDFDSESLAGAQPVVEDDSRVNVVIVVVNLPLLQRLSGLPMASVVFQEDVDRILAHELFGHAVPLLVAGSMSGMCADPERGQNASDSCAIRRENVIRKDLKLGQRVDYGREGLALARRFRQ